MRSRTYLFPVIVLVILHMKSSASCWLLSFFCKFSVYIGCFLKKPLYKCEEKMQEKMEMIKQKDKTLVQVQQQCSIYFCIKLNLESSIFWLIWPFQCLILMILTMAKYHEN